jgi:RNA-directed DNA polymerase
MIGHIDNYSESWKGLGWKKFRKNLFRLQCRLWKAVRAGDMRKARNLQKLILKSQSAIFLAIRQVTQLNNGKKTAGMDGKANLNFKQRFELANLLKTEAFRWKHQRLREIPIPKKNGTTRMLKIPTIQDRAWQKLVHYALEPAHEVAFHARSYGFRTGRSAHDAQKMLFLNLSKSANGANKRILELDLEKCFDRIRHSQIMENIILPQAVKTGIWRCLKKGTNPHFPEQGTPQGGCISPTLANIALNGIEKIHNIIRYADDMVVILKPQDNADLIMAQINSFLDKLGLRINQEKTRLVSATSGFDFLGWHFRVQANGKFKCVPSVDNYKAFRQKVKTIVNCSSYDAKVKAVKLAPLVRGWRNYHRFCKMEGSRFSLWGMRLRTWNVFNKEKKLNRYQVNDLIVQAFPHVSYSENKHINVAGERSPYDGDIIYWSERNSKLYDGMTAKLLRKQHHSCGYCGAKFLLDERVNLHHLDGNHHNWKEQNLIVVHESCHDYIHMSKQR